MIIMERDGSLHWDERAQEQQRASGARWRQRARRVSAVNAPVRADVDREVATACGCAACTCFPGAHRPAAQLGAIADPPA